MILIFSSHLGEFTTDLVIDWLNHKKIDYKRINGIDFIDCNVKVSLDNIEICINGKNINLSDIKVFWYRRLLPYNYFLAEYGMVSQNNTLNIELVRYIQSEFNKITDFIDILYKDKKWLSKISNSSLNKLEVLNNAKELGLKVPDSMITTSRDDVAIFKSKHTSIIVKGISEALGLPIDNEMFISYTYDISDEDIIKLPLKFYPSLVQQNIQKVFELRIFYMNGIFYAMAIFSQNDKSTRTDFRIYNWEKPNRTVPYILPEDIKVRLNNLMVKLGLNCGSIDMIKATNGDFVFLEINPVGQFGMVSNPCNYYLEEKVAEYLHALDKN